MPESSSKGVVSCLASNQRGTPWCLTTSAHRLDAGGAKGHWILEAMPLCGNAHARFYIAHFAFGKRVWTRYAPTARARAAICVQRFDDSLNPAIHITYRVSRRSSSLHEPRDPSLKGGFWFVCVCSKPFGGCGWKKTGCRKKATFVFLYAVCVVCVCE